MFKRLKIWYYRRMFLKIYFYYLKGSDPQNAVNDAFEDIKAIDKVIGKVIPHEFLNAPEQ